MQPSARIDWHMHLYVSRLSTYSLVEWEFNAKGTCIFCIDEFYDVPGALFGLVQRSQPSSFRPGAFVTSKLIIDYLIWNWPIENIFKKRLTSGSFTCLPPTLDHIRDHRLGRFSRDQVRDQHDTLRARFVRNENCVDPPVSIYCFLILALTDSLQFSFPRTFTNG